MARKSMVTRTIETTKVTALCVDLGTQRTYKAEIILSGTYDTEKALMKALSKVVDDDVHRAVSVLSKEVVETLYGMDEQEFISHSTVLPARKS